MQGKSKLSILSFIDFVTVFGAVFAIAAATFYGLPVRCEPASVRP